ncbi:unnamed protein product [Peronospora destructor]|uniref:Uncharacterized protein n=1 Tax=Peronospora destructor TaxID=86335 RepID=A0AAV0V6W8_9STRA|nr:unnamed protein product [Peronospora destructor]
MSHPYSGPIRLRSNSYASSGGLSSPHSIASNFSYASQTTTASSLRSVIDLGDMDKFYQSGVDNALQTSSTPRSSGGTDGRLSFEMQKFFQAYGAAAARGSRCSYEKNGSYGSGSSTVRSSDLNQLRPNDMATYLRRSSASMHRSDHPNNMRHMTSTLCTAGHRPHLRTRPRLSDPKTSYWLTAYHLDDEQRVSLHAIL